jgi:hypothetical protein
MSDYLGNIAARALGLSVVARPRPSLFEPRRASPETLAVEPTAVSPPQEGGAKEALRAVTVRARPRRSSEIEPRPPRKTPSVEPEPEAPPVLALPAEPPSGRTPVRANPPPVDGPTAAPAVAETLGLRAAPLREPAPPPADQRIGTARPTPRTRAAPEPSLAVTPSFPTPTRRAPEPTVRVTIGRIDVRAVQTEQPPEPRKKARPGPRMSLDEYLGKTREGAG